MYHVVNVTLLTVQFCDSLFIKEFACFNEEVYLMGFVCNKNLEVVKINAVLVCKLIDNYPHVQHREDYLPPSED